MRRDAFDDWMRDQGMSDAQVEAARADDAPSERERTLGTFRGKSVRWDGEAVSVATGISAVGSPRGA